MQSLRLQKLQRSAEAKLNQKKMEENTTNQTNQEPTTGGSATGETPVEKQEREDRENLIVPGEEKTEEKV